MLPTFVSAYTDAILDTDRDRALEVVQNAQAAGVTPEGVLAGIVIPAIDRINGSDVSGADISLAQHFMVAQISAAVVEQILPLFEVQPQIAGRIVIGSAHGDFHGLGKRIVVGCLKARMFDVIDLGLNVPAARFVDEAVARGCEVIAISSMMVHTASGPQGCLRVREILAERRLEDRIKIIVGGAPFRHDEGLYRKVGADAWAESGPSAGLVISGLIQEARRR
jgi:trimethylamine corrinoid protein